MSKIITQSAECNHCGTIMVSRKYAATLKATTKQRKFCSHKCSTEYVKTHPTKRNNSITKSCTYCKRDFKDRPLGKKQFCTQLCYWSALSSNDSLVASVYGPRIAKSINGINTVMTLWKSGNYNQQLLRGRFEVKVREHFFTIHDSKCSICNWGMLHPITKKVPLEIDHIDGNKHNNHIHNLRLVCPNCHSLTPTYRSLNHAS